MKRKNAVRWDAAVGTVITMCAITSGNAWTGSLTVLMVLAQLVLREERYRERRAAVEAAFIIGFRYGCKKSDWLADVMPAYANWKSIAQMDKAANEAMPEALPQDFPESS